LDSRQADRIATTLEDMVMTGQLREGERLDETALARSFGVSRTPVREALNRLVQVQLAQRIARRGVFVRRHTSRRLIELFETMAEIEGMCCRLAAGRSTPDLLDALTSLNEKCREAVEAKDAPGYARHNVEFHRTIYRMAGNAFLQQEATRIFDLLKPFRRVQFQLPGRMQASICEHDAIIAALSQGDAAAAARTGRTHISAQGEVYFSKIARRSISAVQPCPV
jgi:DNA-binding GntR family transcriptional regulator